MIEEIVRVARMMSSCVLSALLAGGIHLTEFNSHRSRLVLLRREPPCRAARQRHGKEASAPDHGVSIRAGGTSCNFGHDLPRP